MTISDCVFDGSGKKKLHKANKNVVTELVIWTYYQKI